MIQQIEDTCPICGADMKTSYPVDSPEGEMGKGSKCVKMYNNGLGWWLFLHEE